MAFCAGGLKAQRTIRVPQEVATVQQGIDLAQNGDTVLVAPGTYTENLVFKGRAITVTSGAGSLANARGTIISGSSDGPVITFASGEPPATILNGFTITGGHAAAANAQGGGVFNYGALVPSGCSLNFTNLQLDPQLKNPQNGDLREQDTSPLIAAGDTTAPLIPYVDLDSKARTVCGTIDIGGYEHHPQPPLP